MSQRFLVAIPLLIAAISGASTSSYAQENSVQMDNAHSIIRLAQQFKEEANLHHAASTKQIGKAKTLSAQAAKLTAGTKSLNARIQQNVNGARQETVNVDQYRGRLADFQQHARLYNAHLVDYEKQLLQAQAAEGQLQTACRQYADHVTRYHVPGARPPHVCVQLQQETREMQQAANRFREDLDRTRVAETQLAGEESRLAEAARQRLALENKLLQKASVAEVEQGTGMMLLKEYQELEREYRILQTVKARLSLVK